MYEFLRAPLLRLLRVPPSPAPPAGSADSTEIFHAGRNFYIWSVIRWAFIEALIALSLAGPLISFRLRPPGNREMPPVAAVILIVLAVIAAMGFLLQLLLTGFALRLAYEMQWYIVTDRSLRIRSGVWSVEELTMTFVNIQQITVQQGPVQGVLGIADVHVLSAGGSGSGKPGEKSSGHAGRFRGVDNAETIRDLILERLRRYKDSGLGDPDEPHTALAAAKEVLDEARMLHIAVRG
jgi:membrane protein YdbS with pleckstrin-like domain